VAEVRPQSRSGDKGEGKRGRHYVGGSCSEHWIKAHGQMPVGAFAMLPGVLVTTQCRIHHCPIPGRLLMLSRIRRRYRYQREYAQYEMSPLASLFPDP